ncbi:MAG: T9SS type A sorting domain-containing protein, partial [Bacteroidales bacterium]|nr:T9SS type A sorting domain-containing protein [Bacteroidales bacterium]
SIVLNDYYEPCIDSYQKGEIKYLLSDLDDGLHTLQLKAWDVYNNSSEARIEFIVNKSAKLALNNVLNYPNPFSTGTWFTFKHNKPGEQLDIQIQIFTIEGKLLKILTQKSDSDGINIDPVYWNGLDDNGSRVESGFYIYKLLVKENENIITEQSQKLVIIR